MCLMYKCEIDIQIWDWRSNIKRLTVKRRIYFWHCSSPHIVLVGRLPSLLFTLEGREGREGGRVEGKEGGIRKGEKGIYHAWTPAHVHNETRGRERQQWDWEDSVHTTIHNTQCTVHVNVHVCVVRSLTSYPGLQHAGGRPGTHCWRMCVIWRIKN